MTKVSRAKKIVTDIDLLTAKVPDMEPGPDPKDPLREAVKNVQRKVEAAKNDLLECNNLVEEQGELTFDNCKKLLQEALDEVEKYENRDY